MSVVPIVSLDITKVSSRPNILAESAHLGIMTDDKNTQETLKDGWIHTGDVAEIDPQGRFKIIDRVKVSVLCHQLAVSSILLLRIL